MHVKVCTHSVVYTVNFMNKLFCLYLDQTEEIFSQHVRFNLPREYTETACRRLTLWLTKAHFVGEYKQKQFLYFAIREKGF